jgi:hypothetical protein
MLPFPAVQEDFYDEITHFRRMWPASQDLGLRPLVFLHLIHEPVGITVFLSTEDDALYLWSRDWDEHLFGGTKLIRAGKTIDECEEGIVKGLHAIEFEHGGWLKLDGCKYEQIAAGMAIQEEKVVNWHGRNGHLQV